MRYVQIRDQITEGDDFGVSCKGLFWSLVKVVQHATGLGRYAQITHVGIAWWATVEMDRMHNVLRPVLQHFAEGCAVTGFRAPVRPVSMEAEFESATIMYDYLDLPRMGLRLLFHADTCPDGNGEMVCSPFVANWLQWASWPPPYLQSKPPASGLRHFRSPENDVPLCAHIMPDAQVRHSGDTAVLNRLCGKRDCCFTQLFNSDGIAYWHLYLVVPIGGDYCLIMNLGCQLKTYAEDPTRPDRDAVGVSCPVLLLPSHQRFRGGQ